MSLLVCLATACGSAAEDPEKSSGENAETANNVSSSGAAACSEACGNTNDVCSAAIGGDVQACVSMCEASLSPAGRTCLAQAASCNDVAACDSGSGPANNSSNSGGSNDPGNNAVNNSGEACEPFVDTENDGCTSACDADATIFIDGAQLCTARCSSDADCGGSADCNTDYNGGTCLYRCEGTGLSCPEGFLENTTTVCGDSGWCGI